MKNSTGTKTRNAAVSPASGQRGAALIVGLVLMLALTVLAISGMNMATLELTMAGNMQAQQLAFQRAETGIDMAIASPALTGTMADIVVQDGGENVIVVERGYVTNSLVPDGDGWDTDTTTAYHFDTRSTGTGPRNAVSIHSQSYYVIGPKAP